MTDAAATTPSASLLAAARERHQDLAALLARAATPAAFADEELIHDLRVATRRLEELLRLFKTSLDKTAATAVAQTLKALRKDLGELRDSDVMRDHLAHARLPAALKQVATTFAAELLDARPALVATAAADTVSTSVQTAMLLLSQHLDAATTPAHEDQLRGELRKLLKKRERQLGKSFGKAALRQTPAALHDARIAAKRLRYATELADTIALHPHLPAQLKFLKTVQKLLGDHHDTHVLAEALHDHLAPHPARAVSTAWRTWLRGIHQQQAQRAAKFFICSYQWINR